MSDNKHQKHEEKTKNAARRPLGVRLNELLDVPADVLLGGCCLELRGRGELRVQGCRNILSYSTETITLALRRGVLCVRGAHLICTSYHAGCVQIGGRIDGMDFCESRPHAEGER